MLQVLEKRAGTQEIWASHAPWMLTSCVAGYIMPHPSASLLFLGQAWILVTDLLPCMGLIRSFLDTGM